MPEFSNALIQWFHQYMRDLPWRRTREPYPVWISEVILQQTRVEQGMGYYHRFLSRFPDTGSLANATEEEVLSVWQGLGYYSRARNLHKAARQIHFDLNGVFPDNTEDLLKLKGVGSYTAAAIASFSFGINVPVVDGNVMRVICRIFGIQNDIRLPATQEKVREIAASLLPAGQSWEFNQAIMEVGALICTPAGPACGNCPVASGCFARLKGQQKEIPYKSKATPRRKRYFNYLWLAWEDCLGFRCREDNDIWKGLFEPILFEAERPFQIPDDFEPLPKGIAEIRKEATFLPAQKCILSHQEIQLQICLMKLQEKPEIDGLRWVSKADLDKLPKPVIFSKILRKQETSPLYLIS